jgi:hypothetical protein
VRRKAIDSAAKELRRVVKIVSFERYDLISKQLAIPNHAYPLLSKARRKGMPEYMCCKTLEAKLLHEDLNACPFECDRCFRDGQKLRNS